MVVRLVGVANHPIVATLVSSVIGFGSLRLVIYSYIGGH
jgi:hypothetical protein